MNEGKLISLAKNLSELIPNDMESPQQIYNKCIEIFNSRKEYFINFPGDFLLNLIIYIISYKKTEDFMMAKNILSNRFFLGLLTTEGNNHEKDCDNCEGNGYVECGECDGSGEVTCSECDGGGEVNCERCDGDGKVSCDDCDGSGEDEEGDNCAVCGGSGEVTCDLCSGNGETSCNECGGEGRESCGECDGSGSETCWDCNGRGDIETDALDYTIYNVLSWNKDLNNLCEIRLDSFNSVCDSSDLGNIENTIILLMENYDDEFYDEIQIDEVYCFKFERSPSIYRKSFNFKISPQFDDDDISYFTK